MARWSVICELLLMFSAAVVPLITAEPSSLSSYTAGKCVCVTESKARLKPHACGAAVLDQVPAGMCFVTSGQKARCMLGRHEYTSVQINLGGQLAWVNVEHLHPGTEEQCPTAGTISDDDRKVNMGIKGYRCPLTDRGRRVQEGLKPTKYDCFSRTCKDTCKGGQCVAYVKCRCRRADTKAFPPQTSCWRPGVKVVTPDGRCDSRIPSGTAIATFPRGRYYGHAAVFVGCAGSHGIKTWDQGCCMSVGHRIWNSAHKYFNQFYVIENPGVCRDFSSARCRSEPGGQTCCPVTVKKCVKWKFWYKPRTQNQILKWTLLLRGNAVYNSNRIL